MSGPVLMEPACGSSGAIVASRSARAVTSRSHNDAISVHYSRRRPPQTVTGTGVDKTAALRNLDDRLRGIPQPNGSRMAERERRIRLAYGRRGVVVPRDDRARIDRGQARGVVRRSASYP